MHIHLYVRACIIYREYYMYVCMYVCKYVYIYIVCVYVCINIWQCDELPDGCLMP